MQDIRQYLNSKGIQFKEARRPSGLQAVFPCPQCHDKAFAVSLDTGAFNCFSKNKCGISGSFFDLQKLYGDTYEPVFKRSNILQQVKEKTFKTPDDKRAPVSDAATEFLKQRGFSEATIKHFKTACSPDGKSVMLPSFENGVLVNIKYRSINEKKFWNAKDGKPILFNLNNCTDYDALLMTEGHFDTMAAREYGLNSCSVPNGVSDMSWIELCWNELEKYSRIYLIFDSDHAGQEAVEKIVKRLGEWRCYNVILPHKDMNECLNNKITENEIKKLIYIDAHEYRHNLVVTIDEYKNRLHESNSKRRGVPCKFKQFNDIIRGWRKPEVSLWSGRTGSGKTTMLNEIVLDLMDNHGIRTCVLSLEMPIEKLLAWMTIQWSGYEIPSDDMYNAFIDKFAAKLYMIKSYGEITENILIDAMTYAARKYAIDHFVIDNLAGLTLNRAYDKNESEKIFARRLASFSQEYDCHVHLAAHPRKAEKDSDVPGKSDIGGSGHLTNLVHNVFIAYKPTTEQMEKNPDNPAMTLYIRKNREYGTEGKVNFEFNDTIKRFSERLY